MKKLTYDPQVWKILKNVSGICNMIYVGKKDNKNFIAHKNNNIAYIIKMSDKYLDTKGTDLVFKDFREFFSVLNTVDKEPTIEVSQDKFLIKSKDDKIKINFVMGNSKLVQKVEADPKLTDWEGQFILDSETLAKIKEISKLIGLISDLNKPKIDINISTDGKITFKFDDKNPGNQNNFEYTFDNEVKIDKEINETLNIQSIMDLPTGDYKVKLSTGNIRLANFELANSDKDLSINFFCGYFKN